MVKLNKGDLLVSQPFMMDGNFRRTVIYLAEYNEEGALGFILNRPLDYRADELIADFPEFEDAAYFGGPVSTNTVHYVHKAGKLLDESVEVKEGIYWGGNYEKLKVLIENKLILPGDIKFYVGYSGWTAGQLEDELVHGSWIVAPADANYIFNVNENDLWSKVLEFKGDNYKVIAQMPEAFFSN